MMKMPDFKRRFLLIVCLICLLVLLKVVVGLVFVYFDIEDYKILLSVPVSIVIIRAKELIFLPVFEELGWRLSLKFDVRYLKISSTVLLLDTFFYYERSRYFLELGGFFFLRVVLFSLLLMTVFIWLNKDSNVGRIEKVWKKKYLYVFLLFQFYFALIHLRVFEFPALNLYYIAPVVLASYFVLGCFFSYVRLKVGIFSAILFHVFFNSMYYLVVWIYEIRG